tara:strand:- start:821 stop:1522 length:702 start_codon:yes stop_codon:yes gene_type:complete
MDSLASYDSHVSAKHRLAPAALDPDADLPRGWERRESKGRPGRCYYHHHATGEKTWRREDMERMATMLEQQERATLGAAWPREEEERRRRRRVAVAVAVAVEREPSPLLMMPSQQQQQQEQRERKRPRHHHLSSHLSSHLASRHSSSSSHPSHPSHPSGRGRAGPPPSKAVASALAQLDLHMSSKHGVEAALGHALGAPEGPGPVRVASGGGDGARRRRDESARHGIKEFSYA